MELVYNVSTANFSKNELENKNDHISNMVSRCVCCCLSTRNILAFSAFTSSNAGVCERQCRVYVCDLDSPWDAHEVTRYNGEVLTLCWDVESDRLLVADTSGSCQLWAMQEHMLNKWVKVGEVQLKGETILAVSWFFSGISCYLNVDKKDNPLYSERFCTVVNSPTLSHFGGRALDGFLVVTATGLVSAGIFDPMEGNLQTTNNSLGPTHSRFSLANISHTKDGHFMVATSDGHMTSLIRCYIVTISSQRSYQIDSKPASSFYVKGDKSSLESRVTHINFAGAGNNDTLLIGTSSSTSSSIEIWHLLEQNVFLHSAFQNASPSQAKDSKFKTIKWMHKASITHSSLLIAISPSRLHLIRMSSDVVGGGSVTSFITALYQDGTVKVIQPQFGQVLVTSQLGSESAAGDGKEWRYPQTVATQTMSGSGLVILDPSGPNRVTVQVSITSQLGNESAAGDVKEWMYPQTVATQTMSGSGLVILDPSGIWLYRFINERDQPMYVSPSQLVMLIEYCMVAGFDCWDIILALKQGMCESIVQKLSDTFHKQPTSVQERMNMRFMEAKLAVYLLSGSGGLKATELQAQLVLAGVVVAVQQTLRPKIVTTSSLSPSENLLSVVGKTQETDVDKIILTLDSHDFIVDSGILLSLQHLMQWVTNLSLLLLVSLPHSSHTDHPGSGLLKDATLLQSLRELLVVIRIWSMLHRPCEPKYLTSSSADCLSVIFSLITKVWLTVKEGLEWEDSLIDECSMLPTKIFTPTLESTYSATSRNNYLYTQVLPMSLKLHDTPAFVTTKSQLNGFHPEMNGTSHQTRDVIHQTTLGVTLASGVKQCVRCGCMTACLGSSPKANSLSAAMRAWESRWSKSCFCTGLWKYVPPK